MTPCPKTPSDRNPHLRRMASKYGCMFLWRPGCMGHDTSTTVLCHTNVLADSKGMGYKAHDALGIFGCAVCHAAMDHGGIDAGEKALAWQEARGRMLRLLWDIADSPTARPKDRDTALLALQFQRGCYKISDER